MSEVLSILQVYISSTRYWEDPRHLHQPRFIFFLKQIINLLDATLRPWSLKPWRCGNSWQDKVSRLNDFLTTEKKYGSNEHFIDFIHFKSPRLRWKDIYQTPKNADIFGSSPLYGVHESIKAMEIVDIDSPTRLCSHNFPSVSQGLGSPPARWLDKKNAPCGSWCFFNGCFWFP